MGIPPNWSRHGDAVKVKGISTQVVNRLPNWRKPRVAGVAARKASARDTVPQHPHRRLRRPQAGLTPATQGWSDLAKCRTAVERVNARLKVFWGTDDGQVYGSRRFHGHVEAVMVVHLAFATLLAQTGRYERAYGKMTFSPIAKARHELIRTKAQEAAEA
jgi:hypothetical protein